MSAYRSLMMMSQQLLEALCVAAFGVMLVVAGVAVFFRFVVNSSLAFPEELVGYLFIWTVFLGAAIALRLNMHAAVEMAVDWLPPGAKRIVLIVTNLLCLAFFAVLVVYGTQMVLVVYPQRSPALEISMSYVYASVPVGGLFMLLYSIETLFGDAKARSAPPPFDAEV